jgi:hypothetical protein
MADNEPRNLTQRLGRNRTLLLAVVVVIIITFTVASDIGPALFGSTGDTALEFSVEGRAVRVSGLEFESGFRDWSVFHRGRVQSGMRNGTIDIRQARQMIEDLDQASYTRDLMLEQLATQAGIVIPDATLREFVATRSEFADATGAFDPARFRAELKETYQGMNVRAYEQQARRFLAADHYHKLYANAFFLVTDDEAHARWRTEHPKVKVRFAYQPVSPIRAELKPEDVKQEDLDRHWRDAAVKDRHRIPPRWQVEAVTVAGTDVDPAAVEKALEEWKDDKDFFIDEDLAFAEWYGRRKYDFDIEVQDEATKEALRKINVDFPAPVKPLPKEEGEEKPKDGAAAAPKEEPAAPKDDAAAPKDDAAKEDAPPVPEGPGDIEANPKKFYDWWWRGFVRREMLLKKVLQRVVADATKGGMSLEDAAKKWSRPGMQLQHVKMADPLPQEAIGEDLRLGGNTRYAVNQYGTQDVGKVHPDVLERTMSSHDLKNRGFVCFRLIHVVPAATPELEQVRDALVAEVLDKFAEDRARERLEALRKAVDDGKPFDEAAAAAGIAVDEAGPYNEFSWRPPAPLPKAGEKPAPDGWKDRNRRIGVVISRYLVVREVAPGRFGPVVSDTRGETATGAFYLVRVEERVEPAFGEMNVAQKALTIREIRFDRFRRVAEEMEFEGLSLRLGATWRGEPLPAAWKKKTEGEEAGN